MPKSNKNKKILVGVTGSIAAYKAADIVRRLQESGFQVSVVMTREAERFITPLTLGSLCGEKVYQNMLEGEDAWKMNHIVLARETDLFLIAPATAHTIGKLAGGLADDLLTCVAVTTNAQIVIAPAMNDEMYKNKIVQENIKRLKGIGVKFVDPVKGKLACGVFAEGHLADVETIVGKVIQII